MRQQHCCWESLRDNSLVNLKVQPSQTELLFRSVADCFLPCGRMGHADVISSNTVAAWLTAFLQLLFYNCSLMTAFWLSRWGG